VLAVPGSEVNAFHGLCGVTLALVGSRHFCIASGTYSTSSVVVVPDGEQGRAGIDSLLGAPSAVTVFCTGERIRVVYVCWIDWPVADGRATTEGS
jgi:hypothetical protein